MMGKHHVIVNLALSSAFLTGSALYAPFCQQVRAVVFASVSGPVWQRSLLYAGCAAGLCLGSLFPDIDNRKSLLGRYFKVPGEHRTWTHTLWVCLLLLPMCFVSSLALWFWLGYVLHLLMDSVSAGGVCWLYPITKYRVYSSGAKVAQGHQIKLYYAGKLSEQWIMWVICILCLLFVLYVGIWRQGFAVWMTLL